MKTLQKLFRNSSEFRIFHRKLMNLRPKSIWNHTTISIYIHVYLSGVVEFWNDQTVGHFIDLKWLWLIQTFIKNGNIWEINWKYSLMITECGRINTDKYFVLLSFSFHVCMYWCQINFNFRVPKMLVLSFIWLVFIYLVTEMWSDIVPVCVCVFYTFEICCFYMNWDWTFCYLFRKFHD